VLDGRRDELDALRVHHRWLAGEAERLRALADTAAATIAEREGGAEMAPEELFAGFAEKRARLEDDLVQRYGEGVREHFAESDRRTAAWTAADYRQAGQQWADLEARFLARLRGGDAPDDPQVQQLVDEHHGEVRRYWTPNRASYMGLGELYVDDPEFRARYDAQDSRLAEYLRDAIAVYARQRLS
jgi:hypothetical protein